MLERKKAQRLHHLDHNVFLSRIKVHEIQKTMNLYFNLQLQLKKLKNQNHWIWIYNSHQTIHLFKKKRIISLLQHNVFRNLQLLQLVRRTWRWKKSEMLRWRNFHQAPQLQYKNKNKHKTPHRHEKNLILHLKVDHQKVVHKEKKLESRDLGVENFLRLREKTGLHLLIRLSLKVKVKVLRRRKRVMKSKGNLSEVEP